MILLFKLESYRHDFYSWNLSMKHSSSCSAHLKKKEIRKSKRLKKKKSSATNPSPRALATIAWSFRRLSSVRAGYCCLDLVRAKGWLGRSVFVDDAEGAGSLFLIFLGLLFLLGIWVCYFLFAFFFFVDMHLHLHLLLLFCSLISAFFTTLFFFVNFIMELEYSSSM